MEPTLTPPDPTDDPLEALLRAAPPPIPDDGFTLRVRAALPPRETPLPQHLRWPVLAGAGLLGCALAWVVLSPAEPALPQAAIAAVPGWLSEPWHALAILFVLTVWGTFAVSRNEWECGNLARG